MMSTLLVNFKSDCILELKKNRDLLLQRAQVKPLGHHGILSRFKYLYILTVNNDLKKTQLAPVEFTCMRTETHHL